jgi:hypothetical protein
MVEGRGIVVVYMEGGMEEGRQREEEDGGGERGALDRSIDLS